MWLFMSESLNHLLNRFVRVIESFLQLIRSNTLMNSGTKHWTVFDRVTETFAGAICESHRICSQLICIKTDRWFIHGTKKVTVFMREQTHWLNRSIQKHWFIQKRNMHCHYQRVSNMVHPIRIYSRKNSCLKLVL